MYYFFLSLWYKEMLLLELFKKRFHHDNHVTSVTESASNRHKSKMTGDFCVLKCLRCSVDRIISWVFRV